MGTLNSICASLDNQPSQPPIDQWNPDLSGDIDIVIKSNGDWLHEGDKIQRLSLVKLFFSILRREHDGKYYLITPVEKWRISVEEVAGIIVDMDIINPASKQQQIIFTSNVQRQFLLSQNTPLILDNSSSNNEQLLPYLKIPHGLTAKLTRSVYYRLVESSKENNNQLSVLSEGNWFVLGDLNQ